MRATSTTDINQFPKELSQNKKSGHETHFSRRYRERQRTQPFRPAIDGQHRASSAIILGTDTSISSDALTRNHAVLPTSRTVSSRPKSFAKRLSTARTPLPAERGGDISFDHSHCQAARRTRSRPHSVTSNALKGIVERSTVRQTKRRSANPTRAVQTPENPTGRSPKTNSHRPVVRGPCAAAGTSASRIRSANSKRKEAASGCQ